ncbi:MAG TPA: cupredoxin domain-containing protein [Gemmatimonadaceae bacterium]
MRHRSVCHAGWSLIVLAAACSAAHERAPARQHSAQRRDITITTVPLLSRELQSVYPFLKADFAPGGVLDGKEVYAFEPSTITVMVGDTLHLTLLNPEDDDHAFVLRDLYVPLRGRTRRDTTYVAREPGIFIFSCSVPAHLPMMRGQLVVLPD